MRLTSYGSRARSTLVCLPLFEGTIYMLLNATLVVATAWFLWHPRESHPLGSQKYSNLCNEAYTVAETSLGVHMPVVPPTCSHFVNVLSRFTGILSLYFAYFTLQWLRCLVLLAAACATRHKECLAQFLDSTQVFMFFFGLANIIILHIFRFQPAGKLASGDYQSLSEKQQTLSAYYDMWSQSGSMPDSG